MAEVNTIVLESFLDLDRADIPDPGWLWGNVVARQSLTTAHAGPKRAKSMLTMNLAIAIAAGAPTYLDMPVRGPGRVVIFQREVARFWMQTRLRKMVANAPFPVSDEAKARISHNVSRALRLHDMKTFRDFRRLMQDIKPDYIVLDPLAHVLVEDENDNAAVGRALERIADLRDDPGCGIMVVHHNRKESEANRGVDPTQNARGADRIIADSDGVISLVRGRKDPRGPVSRFVFTLRNSEGSEPFSAVFNKATCWWERTQERGDTELIASWVRSAGSIARSHLIEMIEEQWKLSDPAHHRSAIKYITKAVEAGALEEKGGMLVAAAKGAVK